MKQHAKYLGQNKHFSSKVGFRTQRYTGPVAHPKTYLFHKSYPHSVVSLLPPGLPSRTFARTVSSELVGFRF